jgi:hypothetical protein
VPPTRHCYKAWKFKQQIERLNLLHIDKFGVGTPVAEEGEGLDGARAHAPGEFLARVAGGREQLHHAPEPAVGSRSSATKGSRR